MTEVANGCARMENEASRSHDTVHERDRPCDWLRREPAERAKSPAGQGNHLGNPDKLNADAHLDRKALDQTALKQAMGSFATGLTVVTTRFRGVDFGMTCNSFNTVSLDPALVLWSVSKASASHEAFTQADGYTVSILEAGQKAVAERFARGTSAERFAAVPHSRLRSGRALIDGAVAWFDCGLDNVVAAGDHDILIGRVLDFASNDRIPLGYLRGKFTPLA